MNYDIFISYKNSDDNGNKTPDYDMGFKLYRTLSDLGYKVFFSSDTLEKLGSSGYKNDIDAALDTVKVMVVVLSCPEYASSQWVKYEWDSFYNDYLSGLRPSPNLFTLTAGVDTHDLPRTLRNVQNFDYSDGFTHLCEFIGNILPKGEPVRSDDGGESARKRDITIITGRQVTERDIRDVVMLDAMAYDDIYRVSAARCEEWFSVNPDIYVMARDETQGRIIAYVNISPVTDDCYDRIKRGDFIDSAITADMILSYDMPFPYSVYFSSIVIHPDYRNSEVFMELFNAIVEKFIALGEHDVFVRRMLADAVSGDGEKFCKLFGMKKVKSSDHSSTLYEISMIPPKFRLVSKKTKQLYDYYLRRYNEAPYLFDC